MSQAGPVRLAGLVCQHEVQSGITWSKPARFGLNLECDKKQQEGERAFFPKLILKFIISLFKVAC